MLLTPLLPTQEALTLWTTYSIHRNAYKALPSANDSILLLPVYKQKLKQEVPGMRSVPKWSDEANAKLEECFASTDWNMFRDSSNIIKEITINDFFPTVTQHMYPNKKPWSYQFQGMGNGHESLQERPLRPQTSHQTWKTSI